MQLTRFTDYSLRVLIYLALNPDKWVTIREISDAYSISRNHLMKVVSFLGNQDYLESQRGPGGGIRLRMQPADIRLSDVILDAEGDMTLLECMDEGILEMPDGQDRLRSILSNALQAFLDSLNAHSLQELIENGDKGPGSLGTAS